MAVKCSAYDELEDAEARKDDAVDEEREDMLGNCCRNEEVIWDSVS